MAECLDITTTFLAAAAEQDDPSDKSLGNEQGEVLPESHGRML